MENYIENTEVINAYLNNTLSESEKQAFEKRLETDSEFNQLYNEQLSILGGINRVELKAEINAAKQSYVCAKWMKFIGISVGAILISALIYSFIFKIEIPQVEEPTNNNAIEIVSDSVTVEKYSEEKIEEEIVVEQSESEEILGKKGKIVTTDSKRQYSNDVLIEDIEKNEVVVLEETKEPKPTPQELISFFNSVKKAPQIIEVNTEKEFTVTCKEGTKLTIPAQSFVDAKTGKLARGKINLEVTEYYKLADMLLGNLTTKSDEKQLETGGMLYLDANKKGKKLKLKSGKRIKMAFNNKGKKNMQLFTGEESREGVNWKLQNNEINKIQERIEDVAVIFSIIEEAPIYPGCEGDNEERKKCMIEAMNNFMKANFNVSIAKKIGLTGVQKINTNFTIYQDGTIDKIYVNASRKELGDEAIRVLKSMPKLKAGLQKGIAVKTMFSLSFVFSLEGETINQAGITVTSDGRLIKEIGKKLDSTYTIGGTLPKPHTTTTDIVRYAFATSSLGWINCDRFTRTTSKKVKYKLKIKNADGTNVKMVFKSMSSILPSSKRENSYEFGWVPKDEEVVLIAIKWKDNKIFLGKKETNTTMVPGLDFDFKEVTIEELKGELETLNNTFN